MQNSCTGPVDNQEGQETICNVRPDNHPQLGRIVGARWQQAGDFCVCVSCVHVPVEPFSNFESAIRCWWVSILSLHDYAPLSWLLRSRGLNFSVNTLWHLDNVQHDTLLALYIYRPSVSTHLHQLRTRRKLLGVGNLANSDMLLICKRGSCYWELHELCWFVYMCAMSTYISRYHTSYWNKYHHKSNQGCMYIELQYQVIKCGKHWSAEPLDHHSKTGCCASQK